MCREPQRARGATCAGTQQPSGQEGAVHRTPVSPTGSCPGCCPGICSWPAASSSCAGAGTPESSPPAQRWGRSAGGLSAGAQGTEPTAAPHPTQGPRGPTRLTLGTKPGSTFFSLSSSHSTSAKAGAACMSWRLASRCSGFTVRSCRKRWSVASPRPRPAEGRCALHQQVAAKAHLTAPFPGSGGAPQTVAATVAKRGLEW